ncbi:MAG: type II secretion system GspH family protein [Magnetococcus sp. DMHC-6]
MTNRHHHKKSIFGFTLVEIAMVVMLIGIIASLGISSLTLKIKQTSYKVTEMRMEAIKETMIAYLRRNKRLPCPNLNNIAVPVIRSVTFDGLEDSVSGVCTLPTDSTLTSSDFGVLPYSTLGLAREQVMDGWGNFFSYKISTAPINWTGEDRTIFESDTGALILNSNSGYIVIVVSHGPNGDGAYTTKGTRNKLPSYVDAPDEYENIEDSSFGTDGNFIDSNLSTISPEFDDIVIGLNMDDLVAPLIKDGTVNTDGELVNNNKQQLKSIYNTLTGYMLLNFPSTGNCNFPNNISDLGTSVPQNDPWGTPYNYTKFTNIDNTTDASETIFNITSTNGYNVSMTKGEGVALFLGTPFAIPECMQ